jgi:hypothetical protein
VPVVPASGASGILRPITVGVGGSCHADDMEELEAAIEVTQTKHVTHTLHDKVAV